ncbi:MAG: DUF2490 domain-containing protein, partial [Candidatus Krumholzibacteriota bacterium]|nr:DUF2490 domain-containing protein [Candidatus Krumholzibacteriota bacterium]
MIAVPLKRVALVALGAWLLVPTALVAQDDPSGTTTNPTQVWADYHLHYFRNRTVEYYGDGGLRFLTGEFSWAQGYVRPSVRFHNFQHFDLHLGLGVFYTYNEGISDELEVRPWQGVRARWPSLGPLVFSHYVRLEERISAETGSRDLSLALRLRYKLGTRIPIKKAFHHHDLDPLYIPISGEVFLDVGDNIELLFRDQARFDTGLGFIFNNTYAFTDRFSGEEGYFSGEGTMYQHRLWQTNFVPHAGTIQLYDQKERGAGGLNVTLDLAANSMVAHISQFPVGTYKKAHRHGPGAHLIILEGEGYSLFWQEGQERIKW